MHHALSMILEVSKIVGDLRELIEIGKDLDVFTTEWLDSEPRHTAGVGDVKPYGIRCQAWNIHLVEG